MTRCPRFPAGRPSASASATDSRNVSRPTGRLIHAASFGTSSSACSGSPTRISGRFAPSTLVSRVNCVAGTSETSAISASTGRARSSRPKASIVSMGTGSYPASASHSRNAARSPGMGQATPILIGLVITPTVAASGLPPKPCGFSLPAPTADARPITILQATYRSGAALSDRPRSLRLLRDPAARAVAAHPASGPPSRADRPRGFPSHCRRPAHGSVAPSPARCFQTSRPSY